MTTLPTPGTYRFKRGRTKAVYAVERAVEAVDAPGVVRAKRGDGFVYLDFRVVEPFPTEGVVHQVVHVDELTRV